MTGAQCDYFASAFSRKRKTSVWAFVLVADVGGRRYVLGSCNPI